MPTYEKIRISKLEAGRRQLRTAIMLWFNDGDPVAVHSLAFAAYEILHDISKKRDPKRVDLIFDSVMIEEERRAEWNRVLRKDANFFKHADRDGDSVIEFTPQTSEIFMLFASWARELCGERDNDEELFFRFWVRINRPEISSDETKKLLAKQMKDSDIKNLRKLSKKQFLEFCRKARIIDPISGVVA
jgi:hypothetical protein